MEYARGINVDMDRITSATQDLDISNPDKLQEVLSSGILVPGHCRAARGTGTPRDAAGAGRRLGRCRRCAGRRGSVADPVPAAGGPAPTSGQGGPAEKTFATLVGLELRPRRLRGVGRAVGALTEARGQDGRDAVWAHPDLLPTSDDLEMPEAFVMSSNPDQASSFEVELAAMASGAGPLAEDAADDA